MTIYEKLAIYEKCEWWHLALGHAAPYSNPYRKTEVDRRMLVMIGSENTTMMRLKHHAHDWPEGDRPLPSGGGSWVLRNGRVRFVS